MLALRHRLPGGITEEEWLKLLWRSLVFDVHVDDEPVGSEYREYFDEWFA